MKSALRTLKDLALVMLVAIAVFVVRRLVNLAHLVAFGIQGLMALLLIVCFSFSRRS